MFLLPFYFREFRHAELKFWLYHPCRSVNLLNPSRELRVESRESGARQRSLRQVRVKSSISTTHLERFRKNLFDARNISNDS